MPRKRSISLISNKTGSRNSSEPEFLAVGKLKRPHGIRGEILLSVWTEFPDLLVPGVVVFIKDDHQPVKISSVRWHQSDILIAFEKYKNREDAGLLRNQIVYIHSDDLPSMSDGEIYKHQIIGMNVINEEESTTLGVVTEILLTGANDVYIVRDQLGSEILLPDIDSVIKEIDIENNAIYVRLLPGLLPGNK